MGLTQTTFPEYLPIMNRLRKWRTNSVSRNAKHRAKATKTHATRAKTPRSDQRLKRPREHGFMDIISASHFVFELRSRMLSLNYLRLAIVAQGSSYSTMLLSATWFLPVANFMVPAAVSGKVFHF